jgi:hypothetical protein
MYLLHSSQYWDHHAFLRDAFGLSPSIVAKHDARECRERTHHVCLSGCQYILGTRSLLPPTNLQGYRRLNVIELHRRRHDRDRLAEEILEPAGKLWKSS